MFQPSNTQWTGALIEDYVWNLSSPHQKAALTEYFVLTQVTEPRI